MQPRQHWRVHGTQFIFFKPFHDQPVFYNRDQLVSGPPLNTLGINYHGDLTLTAYGCVFTGLENGRYQTYLRTLGAAADKAFRTMPELAIQLACDILTDISQEAGTITHQLKPADGSDGESYRQAFITAWRILDPDLPADKTLFPCEPKLKYINLVKELGMVPVIVRSDSIRTILSDAGAFKNIEAHALDLLIRTPRSAQVIPGFNRFQLAISRLVPSVQPSSIVLRDYRYSNPKVVWDAPSKAFSVAIPDECIVHTGGGCLCWVGPCLVDAIKSWAKNTRNEAEKPSQPAIWRAYMWSMVGVADMKEARIETNVEPNVDNTRNTDGGRSILLAYLSGC